MNDRTWTALTPPLGAEHPMWELFHENSKGSAHEPTVPTTTTAAHASRVAESLDFSSCSVTTLPAPRVCQLALTDVFAQAPETAASEPGPISGETLATILQHAYGTFPALDDQPGARRPVSSLAAVHTLELFVHCSRVEDVTAGLFHYSPASRDLRLLRRTDHSHQIAAHLRDQSLAYSASAVIFIAAVPERAALLYGERGYRYVLIDAGAVLQNLAMISRAVGVACVPTGEYLDRRLDAMLGFDGVTISTVCVVMICKAVSSGTTDGGRTTAQLVNSDMKE